MPDKIKIAALQPDVTGVYILAGCENCQSEFKQYIPTIFGLGIDTITCPGCSASSQIDPVAFLELVENCMPPVVDHDATTEAASLVAEKWYRTHEIAGALSFNGINLGEPAERFLVSIITNGLLLSRDAEPDK